MQPIEEILKEILEHPDYSYDVLARELDVTPSSVSRWVNGASQPRPLIEGKVREIYDQLTSKNQIIAEAKVAYTLPLIRDEATIKDAIDATLIDIREVLHRRGRLSSRNEALEELSRLLFAHVMSDSGISKRSILGKDITNSSPAQALNEFVKQVFNKHLPRSLCHEMSLTDFELRLRPQENALAIEIIEAFEWLTVNSKIQDVSHIRDIDILNDVFGKFLAGSFINEKELGQYLTPTEVVKFMVQLAIQDMASDELDILCHPVECISFGLVLDPSCGVGSFLTEILRVLRDQVSRKHGVDALDKWIENMVTEVMVGIDKSERMVKLALANMAMFGLPAAQLHLANALSRVGTGANLSKSLEGRVKLILTNPPFGAEFKGKDLQGYRIASESGQSLKKINSELLFMERYLDWLAPNGQLLAIVPDSILTNKGIYETLRKQLADSIEIRSVISLPSVTFGAAGTNTKTSILHIRKLQDRARKDNTTFCAVCQDIGYSIRTKSAHRTKQTNGDGYLPKILEAYSSLSEVSPYGRRVDNITNLPRWDANYHIALPPKIIQRLNNPSGEDIFVSTVAKLSGEKTDPRRWGTGDFQYIEISDIDFQTCMIRAKTIPCAEAPSRARKLVRTGDVLVSTVRPERQIVGVVQPEQDGSVCSTGLAVLRPHSIHPLVLAHLLKTDFVTRQIVRNTLGIAYPAIDEQCLLDILLPIQQQDLDSLHIQAQTILDLEERVQTQRVAFQNVIKNMTPNWSSEEIDF